ncbi:MAG: Radical SAM domain protein, partial [Candidatus Gottesmanbacteria bacterium GW2011_GWC2_42_8]
MPGNQISPSSKIVQQYKKIYQQIEKYYHEGKLLSPENNKSKLFIGSLSPGCQACISGKWACVFINTLCTRDCFFCPQDRSQLKDGKPTVDGIDVNSPEDLIDFLRKFNFQGVAFSGGEPLLAFDLLQSYISKIKAEFGKKMYIWMYTNGDLATEDRLRRLVNAGLDEIRFDLSARKYDFRPVKLAKTIVKKVTIETPVVPEEAGKLKASIKIMSKIGINYLNLHELLTTKFNFKAFRERNYHINRNKAVFESDLHSLKILENNADFSGNLNINYCTTSYKHKFQGRGYN